MELKDHEPCPVCGRYNNRRVSIDALIIKDNKILLIKRGVEPYKDMWALPGGGIEFDEDAREALRKEVEEEVGLKVTSAKFLHIYTDPKRDPKQGMSLSYLVEAEGEVKPGSDAASYQYVPLDSLPEEMAFDHKKIIKDYLTQK